LPSVFSSSLPTTIEPSAPAFSAIRRAGVESARRTMSMPTCWSLLASRELQVFSPAQIEYLIEGYFNTWATYGLTLTDAAFFDDRPDMRWDQLPVIRSFFRQEPACIAAAKGGLRWRPRLRRTIWRIDALESKSHSFARDFCP